MTTTTNRAGLMATPLNAIPAPAAQHPENPVPAGGYDLGRLLACLPDAVDVALKTAVPSEYTPQKVAEIVADLTARFTAQYGPQPVRCPVHTWCGEQGDHDDHLSVPVYVFGPDGEELASALLIDFGHSRTTIGLNEVDLSPAQARQAAADFHRFADQLNVFADQAEQAGGAR